MKHSTTTLFILSMMMIGCGTQRSTTYFRASDVDSEVNNRLDRNRLPGRAYGNPMNIDSERAEAVSRLIDYYDDHFGELKSGEVSRELFNDVMIAYDDVGYRTMRQFPQLKRQAERSYEEMGIVYDLYSNLETHMDQVRVATHRLEPRQSRRDIVGLDYYQGFDRISLANDPQIVSVFKDMNRYVRERNRPDHAVNYLRRINEELHNVNTTVLSDQGYQLIESLKFLTEKVADYADLREDRHNLENQTPNETSFNRMTVETLSMVDAIAELLSGQDMSVEKRSELTDKIYHLATSISMVANIAKQVDKRSMADFVRNSAINKELARHQLDYTLDAIHAFRGAEELKENVRKGNVILIQVDHPRPTGYGQQKPGF